MIDVVSTSHASPSNDSLPRADGTEFDWSDSRTEISQDIDKIVASLEMDCITEGNRTNILTIVQRNFHFQNI